LEAYRNNNKIFVLGNGGSASNASHFANEFNKGCAGGKKRFRVIALVNDVPTITAWANDMSYDDIFSEQLRNFVEKGDVVVGISSSGNSKNVLKAIRIAKDSGAKTIGLVGFSGGELRNTVDVCIHIKDEHYGRTEDLHMMIFHYIGEYIRSSQGI